MSLYERDERWDKYWENQEKERIERLNNVELSPCFCGSKVRIDYYTQGQTPSEYVYIVCDNCEYKTKAFENSYRSGKKELVEWWNSKHSTKE